MPDTRSRLIDAARHLFRRHGYHGVGLSAILTEARASKGSLYHAFPAGKPDLALAAADAASAEILAGIATAFAAVRDYPAGVAALLRAFADDFDAGARAAPVTPLLPPDDPAFRTHAALIRGRWIRALAYQAIRLGRERGERRGSRPGLAAGAGGRLHPRR